MCLIEKKKTLIVALGLEDPYNIVDFKTLIRILVIMKIDPYVTRSIRNALLKKKVALQL